MHNVGAVQELIGRQKALQSRLAALSDRDERMDELVDQIQGRMAQVCNFAISGSSTTSSSGNCSSTSKDKYTAISRNLGMVNCNDSLEVSVPHISNNAYLEYYEGYVYVGTTSCFALQSVVQQWCIGALLTELFFYSGRQKMRLWTESKGAWRRPIQVASH